MTVIPAKAAVLYNSPKGWSSMDVVFQGVERPWMPAFAGMTGFFEISETKEGLTAMRALASSQIAANWLISR